ncbi:hypothetical protein [uncultured Vagococcus sp.]|uniref:hypothetical protein n=1 Tax=uncultured Vagococcus sp. TaxID=189676 RepID=UPI0028D1449F|nr:hypothetical protein [uncultured Vagococcus sp.]
MSTSLILIIAVGLFTLSPSILMIISSIKKKRVKGLIIGIVFLIPLGIAAYILMILTALSTYDFS